jgi:uncharacterized protein (TIGR03435 family)
MKTCFLSTGRKVRGRGINASRFPLHACALLDESFILADLGCRLNVKAEHRWECRAATEAAMGCFFNRGASPAVAQTSTSRRLMGSDEATDVHKRKADMRTARRFIRQSLALQSTFAIAALALMLNCPWNQAQAQAQLPGQPAQFEVVSIKPNKSNERMYYGLRSASLTVRNMTVMGLIQAAYGKRDFQITGGPAWITSEFFDIDAKAESPLKATHEMEKSLLASRFHLELHRETKETSLYSLTVARSGLKMKLSADQTEPEKGGPKELGPGRLVGEGIPMYVIVNLFSNMLGRAIINNTGLSGKYDVNLQPVPDSIPLQTEPANPLAQADILNLAIAEAAEKQLGLKIDSIKAPEEVLVIDRIEHPSAN